MLNLFVVLFLLSELPLIGETFGVFFDVANFVLISKAFALFESLRFLLLSCDSDFLYCVGLDVL